MSIRNLTRTQWMAGLAMVAMLALYAWFQTVFYCGAALEEDTDAYLILANRMAHGGPLAVRDTDPFIHHAHPWVENDRGEVIPKYAPGYPALMAIANRLGGDNAMFLVSPILGGLTLIGAFLLFRQWKINLLPSLLAVFSLIANFVFMLYSNYPLTHVVDLCFLTWGMLFLWRWVEAPAPVRGLAAGLLLGFAATVRHSSVLAGLVVLVAVGSAFITGRKTKNYPVRATVILALAFAVFPALLAWYDAAIFGSPFRTGYSLTNEQNAFSLASFRMNFVALNGGLNNECLFLLFPLGLVGMLIGSWTDRLMRLLWFLPVYLSYVCYYWGVPHMAYYRFMCPVLTLLAGSAYLLLQHLDLPPLNRHGLMFVLTGVLTAHGTPQLYGLVQGHNVVNGARPLAAMARLMEPVLPDDAVIFSTPPMNVFLGTRKNFREYNLQVFTPEYGRSATRFAKAVDPSSPEWQRTNYDIRYVPRGQEQRWQRFREFYASNDAPALKQRKKELVTTLVNESRQVVFLIPPSRLGMEQSDLGPDLKLELIKTWDVPRAGPWALYSVNKPVTPSPSNPSTP